MINASITLQKAKTEKSCFLIQFSRNFIVKIPIANDVIIPTITSLVNTRSPTFNTVAPHITGTDNRKVNFVIASFDIPCNLPARIVVPLLEKPGITAKA